MSDTVEVLCSKLVEDADKWRAAAGGMDGASQTAAGLAMSAKQFGAIADDRGVVSAYAALQQKLQTLASGAATEFNKIADTLTQVAQTYLMEDQAGEHAMRKLEDRL
jgi:hypothetical protein